MGQLLILQHNAILDNAGVIHGRVGQHWTKGYLILLAVNHSTFFSFEPGSGRVKKFALTFRLV